MIKELRIDIFVYLQTNSNSYDSISIYRRATSKVPDKVVCHLGSLWNSSNNPLGMLTRWRTNCWGNGSSHHSHVCHLWCCIFLLSDENARETDARIG